MSRRSIRCPSSWSPEQKARFEEWVEAEEARDSGSALPREGTIVGSTADQLILDDPYEPDPPDARNAVDRFVRVHPIGPDYGPQSGFIRGALDEIERQARETVERHVQIENRGRRREPEGQSALPRFSPYAIPTKVDPLAVDCPYCVKRPRNLRAHCRAAHPDKPEAR